MAFLKSDLSTATSAKSLACAARPNASTRSKRRSRRFRDDRAAGQDRRVPRAARSRANRSTRCCRKSSQSFARPASAPLGMRHFDVQIMGGQVLYEGRIAEMKTGEGKTLVATLPVYARALEGRGVHVVTVNDYLARRDAEWMGPVYEFLGLTRRHHSARPRLRRSAARRTTATSPTSRTTRSASTTCATTWRGRWKTSCSASCTSRSSTKSTRF